MMLLYVSKSLYATLLEEMNSFTGLQGNFSEAELPKMP
jgi:hypothetical protein